MQCSTLQCITIQCNIIQCSTMKNMEMHSVKLNPVQSSPAQCSALDHSDVWDCPHISRWPHSYKLCLCPQGKRVQCTIPYYKSSTVMDCSLSTVCSALFTVFSRPFCLCAMNSFNFQWHLVETSDHIAVADCIVYSVSV